MLKDPPRVDLKVGGPITRKSHDDAVLLASNNEKQFAENAKSYCHGRRQFGRPMLALTAKKSLGPVRHILSQMVVAGSMKVNPPVQVRITSTHDGAAEQGE
jgi:hypothetical protein